MYSLSSSSSAQMETFMSIEDSCSHSVNELALASVRPKRKEVQVERSLRRPDIQCTDVSDEGRMTNGCVNCEVREPNKKSRIWLETYETAEVAARAYDDVALALRGRSACLNFADSVWRLPRPHSTDPKDIRKVAAEAAELFSASGREKSTMGDRTEDNSFFVDDDEEFGMAGLLESMAEGLLMPPPAREGNVNDYGDEENGSGESLWSFSV